MLLGADIHTFMEHKNLMFNTLKTQYMLRQYWYMKIEQFSSLDVKGPTQYPSHNYSRLHCLVTPAQIVEGKKLIEPAEVSNKEEDKVCFLDQEYSGLYDDIVWERNEYYLNLPETSHSYQNPLNYAHICELQQRDQQLLDLQVNDSDNQVNLQLDDNVDDFICYKRDLVQPNWNNCIAQINGSSFYQMVPPASDETSWWEKGYVRH